MNGTIFFSFVCTLLRRRSNQIVKKKKEHLISPQDTQFVSPETLGYETIFFLFLFAEHIKSPPKKKGRFLCHPFF